MLMALGVAYLLALLVGDFIFPQGWRAVQVLGLKGDRLSDLLEGQSLPFAAIWVSLVLALSYISHVGSGHFFTWYSQYGYATSVLRGTNETLKVNILDEMTRAPDERLTGYAKMTWEQWDAEEASVRQKARWCTGEIARRMTKSVELLDSGESGGEWVRELHTWMLKNVLARAMREFSETNEPEMLSALAYVLGGLRPLELMPLYEAYLTGSNRNSETDTVVILAIAESRDISNGIPLLRELLRTSERPELISLAIWAAGEIYGLGTGLIDEAPPDSELVQILKGRILSVPFAVQCVVLDALTRLRTEATNREVFLLFESIDPTDRRCERMEVKTPFGKPILISRDEELREKALKVLASVAEGSDEVMAWLEKQSQAPELASGLRHDMRYILDVLSQRKKTN
jgi:hypothetical protein